MSQKTGNSSDQKASFRDRLSPVGFHPLVLVAIFVILLALSVFLAIKGFVQASVLIAVTALIGGTITLVKYAASVKSAKEKLEKMEGLYLSQEGVIANFSHKIREPLNDLVIIGQMLSEPDSSTDQQELIEALIASTGNMVSTVNELSTQSIVTGFTLQRRRIRFSLLPAIQNTIDLFRQKEIKDINIALSSSSEGNGELTGDPVNVKQIILSILNSAVQYHHGEASSIEISTVILRESATGVTFGISVKADSLILRQLTEETEISIPGKLIVEAGGRFRSETIGKDTVFTFSMSFDKGPVESDHHEPSPKIIELKREEKKVRKELKDINMLLVEDNDINRRITLLTLQPLVKSIDTAANGKEALDMLATSTYDIILMDIQMPVMNGLVASEKIRSLEKSTQNRVPIIAITANAMLGDKEKCMAAGMDAYISKPFQPAQLIENIKKFL